VKRFVALLPALLLLLAVTASAASRVFSPVAVDAREVAETVRALYGDQVRAEVINQRLVVLADAKQMAEIAELIAELERAPAPLRLTLSEAPPVDEISGTVYRSGGTEYRIDTVEGALVELEASRLGERAATDGWTAMVEEVPVRIDALVLNLRLHRDQVLATYSFTRKEQDERRVYGNRRVGALGQWMPLLPRIDITHDDSRNRYSTDQLAGRRAQLYIKVERIE
jgi:hypothetical protein